MLSHQELRPDRNTNVPDVWHVDTETLFALSIHLASNEFGVAGWLVGWRQKRAEKARRREATPLLRTHQLVGVTRLHTPHIYREFIGTRFFIVTPQKPPATVKKVNCRPFNMWVIKKVTNASLRHIGPQSGLFIKQHIKRSALYLLHSL